MDLGGWNLRLERGWWVVTPNRNPHNPTNPTNPTNPDLNMSLVSVGILGV